MRQSDGYLSKREQQIMELAYQRERLTANEVVESLPGKPSNSTVRTLLRILEEKGHLKHIEEGGKFVYSPTHARQAAAQSALKGVIETFFRGSANDVVAALLRDQGSDMSAVELQRLQDLIDQAKAEGR